MSRNYLTSNNSKMVQDSYSYNGRSTLSRARSTERQHFQWPWTTPNYDFKVTPFFDAENRRNGTRYRHSVLLGVSFQMTLGDVQWLSDIINDTKQRAVSLRQLSFLSLTSSIAWLDAAWPPVMTSAWRQHDANLPHRVVDTGRRHGGSSYDVIDTDDVPWPNFRRGVHRR